MKSLILIFGVVAGINFAYGQVIVNGVDINKVDTIKYINAYYDGSRKRAAIDYGQGNRESSLLSNTSGKAVKMNSEIHMLNYLVQRGWELQSMSYPTNSPGVYILRKKEN